MSGDQLRKYAIMGDDMQLKAALRGGANPCSRDNDGLTALHYACWNGHALCAEILVANDTGTDEDGHRISSLDLRSDSGFTALHLSVSGSVPDVATVRYLVLAGANVEIVDELGRTAKDLALEVGFMKAATLVFATEPPTAEECDNFYHASRDQHLVQTSRDPDYSLCEKDEKGEPIITREDKVPIPVELTMYEHHIYPFATKNYKASRKDGALAIRNLEKVLLEAQKNEDRRDLLANSVEANLRKEGKMNWRRGSISEGAKEERKKKGENRHGRRGSVIK